jgi:hypothetical protein
MLKKITFIFKKNRFLSIFMIFIVEMEVEISAKDFKQTRRKKLCEDFKRTGRNP